MNLRQKLFLILFTTTTIFLVGLFTISTSVLLKGYEAIEDRQLNQNIERLQEIISNELENLKTTVNAWSVWDESYNFIQKKDPAFYRTNFLIDSIFDVRFSEVVYFNLKGEILLAQDYNYLERKYVKPDPGRMRDLKNNFWKIHLTKNPNSPFYGLYSYKDHFELFTMNPIFKGSGTGQPNGYMLVFREFDQEMIRKFQKIIKFKLKTSTLRNHPIEHTVVNFKKLDKEVVGFVSLPGLMNRNALLIEIIMPRTIYLFGAKTLGKYLGLISLSAYLSIGILFFIFDKAIIKRIAHLKRNLNEISKELSGQTRVDVVGHDEISDLAQNINSTLLALDQKQSIINRSSKLTALGEMAASIAHEINGPLSVIGGYATRVTRMIAQEEINQEQLSAATQKISSNVFRIDKIIKSLRVIARDSDSDEKMTTTIGVIFEDVLSLCQVKLNLRNIKLDLSEFNPNIELHARPIQISQVMLNLINNAIDAVENQPSPWIKLSTQQNELETIIELSDSGDKIPDTIVGKIMEPFFTTKAPGKGTGLGLSISKSIIESHGGKFKLITEPHTCFQIIIPR
jgi:signal transduction histidine kinase